MAETGATGFSEAPGSSSSYQLVGDDVVVPYAVGPLDVRGRAVQLGPMLDQILNRHGYPEPVSYLLGELIVLSVLLGTSLKFDGNFILQTQSDGPVSLTVVDFSTPDAVRAYARFDESALKSAMGAGNASPRELIGKGVMAMTIDQGTHMQRYQGVVPLEGQSMEEIAHQYFRQSEQIPTRLKLGVAQSVTRSGDTGEMKTSWRAGGILCQFLPEASDRVVQRDLPDGSGRDEEFATEDDAWVEAAALVDTVGVDELTDPRLSIEQLLYRLFNEHGVRVFNGLPVSDKCTCSREKVVNLVRNFKDEPNEEGKHEEVFRTVCEFCNTVYEVRRDEL